MRQIDRAGCVGAELAGGGGERDGFGVTRPRDSAVDLQRAQGGQFGQARHQAARRFVQPQCGLYGARIDHTVQAIGSRAIEPVDDEFRARVFRRAEPAGAGNAQRGGVAGDGSGQVEPVHAQRAQIDTDRQGQPVLGGRLRLDRLRGRDGQACHLHVGGRHTVEPGDAADQRGGRPVQRHIVQRQPHAARVTHLHMGQTQGVGEPPGQAAQCHDPTRQTVRLVLDEGASRADIRGRQHDEHECHRQQNGDGQNPQDNFADAMPPGLGVVGRTQNACPRPR